MIDPETLCSLLVSVQVESGLSAALAFFMSFALEWERVSAWFQALDKKLKRLIVMGLSMVIGMAAYGLAIAFGCQAHNPQMLWTVLVNTLSAYTSSQLAHLISDK